ncbi:DUF87 domain-containing protein [Grimontia hollisae]|uniref:helicase HerA domain-containing protein n=1 Tax=Grimontia hollisae TaxID=673 RepID=UPI0023D99500|nr:DUF87 domain-containing protein [Grimontia hollisae]MDF2185455.1 DUF87 domain-containing protein [Grimontia hollisae]
MSDKRIDTALTAQHEYICGTTGAGKSSHVKRVIDNASRVAVFDPDDEYSELKGFVRVDSARAFLDHLYRYPKGALKIAYVAEGSAAFDFWCNAVFAWGRCVAVAEEIADVTSPAKAPPAWGRLLRRGRKRAIKIMAVTQRPAEADKTALSQAAIIRTGLLGRDADRVSVAREMNINPEALAGLVQLDWVAFRRADLSVTKGNLTHQRVETLRAPVT